MTAEIAQRYPWISIVSPEEGDIIRTKILLAFVQDMNAAKEGNLYFNNSVLKETDSESFYQLTGKYYTIGSEKDSGVLFQVFDWTNMQVLLIWATNMHDSWFVKCQPED